MHVQQKSTRLKFRNIFKVLALIAFCVQSVSSFAQVAKKSAIIPHSTPVQTLAKPLARSVAKPVRRKPKGSKAPRYFHTAKTPMVAIKSSVGASSGAIQFSVDLGLPFTKKASDLVKAAPQNMSFSSVEWSNLQLEHLPPGVIILP